MLKMPYMTGLDGVRSIAVLAVIAYHLNLPYISGGFLGVTVFFVLSGYLITNLLMCEWENKGTIDLGNFWFKRAKRLLPAIFFLLIVLNIFVPLLKPDLVSNLHKESIAGLFYFSNWYYIFRDISYFESFEMTSLLNHFWSLAIEEQFYIVWAFLLFLFLKMGFKTKKNFLIVGGLALLSAIWMGFLYQPNEDPSRIYYGTDTRLFSLLIGAAFAIIFPSYRLKKNLPRITKWMFEILGISSLIILIIMMFTINQYNPFVYQGGMVLVSILTGIIVLSLALPTSMAFNKALSIKPLQWIGVRSYGIYLWHYPIIQWFTNKADTNGLSIGKVILEIALILAFSVLSYEMVEKPIRYGTYNLPFKRLGTILICTCLLYVTMNDYTNLSYASHSQPTNEVSKNDDAKNQGSDNHVLEQPEMNNESDKILIEEKITAIGDSILVNPSPYLKEIMPNITIDAKIGRQMWDVIPILQNLKNQNQLYETVVLALGSNGVPTDKYFDELMKTIGSERKVYFVNTRVSKPWGSEVNKLLTKKSQEFNNMKVIDWYSASANHNEYFLEDGVHTSETIGAPIFAKLIAQSIKDGK